MRYKRFFLILTCLVVFFWCQIYLISEYRTTLQSLLLRTSKFRGRFKNNGVAPSEWNEKHMLFLGFTVNPRLYPHKIWLNTSLPVIVTTLFAGDGKMGIGFAKNTAHMAGNHSVLMYNIGLSSSELQAVSAHCNTSQCQIISFDIKLFPSHVQNNPTQTVKALVIQDALNKAGGILYLDNKFRIISDIHPLIKRKPIGCFKTNIAVTTLTHPKMIKVFEQKIEDFIFLSMVDTNRLLLWNTIKLHELLMHPWIQCVLTSQCVSPIGAQSHICSFKKKPYFRYSGCHAYAASAFSVLLGKVYKYDELRYIFPMDDTFFALATAKENTTLS